MYQYQWTKMIVLSLWAHFMSDFSTRRNVSKPKCLSIWCQFFEILTIWKGIIYHLSIILWGHCITSNISPYVWGAVSRSSWSKILLKFRHQTWPGWSQRQRHTTMTTSSSQRASQHRLSLSLIVKYHVISSLFISTFLILFICKWMSLISLNQYIRKILVLQEELFNNSLVSSF